MEALDVANADLSLHLVSSPYSPLLLLLVGSFLSTPSRFSRALPGFSFLSALPRKCHLLLWLPFLFYEEDSNPYLQPNLSSGLETVDSVAFLEILPGWCLTVTSMRLVTHSMPGHNLSGWEPSFASSLSAIPSFHAGIFYFHHYCLSARVMIAASVYGGLKMHQALSLSTHFPCFDIFSPHDNLMVGHYCHYHPCSTDEETEAQK